MTFSDDIQQHRRNLEERLEWLFLRTTQEVQKAITDGSELSGAPGQPVQTGALRGSWIPSLTAPYHWQTSTNLIYAPFIEDGAKADGTPLTLRSEVGGFHSVKLIRTNWSRIVDFVAARDDFVGVFRGTSFGGEG